MKYLAACVFTILAVLGLGVAANASATSPTGTRTATKNEIRGLASLERLARSWSRENQDPSVRTGLIVLTTREHAAGRDIVNSNQTVYEFIVHGNFVCDSCSHPAGVAAPHGTVLTLTIDRKTLEITDFGVGDRSPTIPATAAEYSFSF
jgi:hypothetical protein